MSEPFQVLTSKTVTLSQANIDTDQIIPARFLTTTTREGLGKAAFYDWRYEDDGSEKPEAILNRIDPAEHRILLAGRNFACGEAHIGDGLAVGIRLRLGHGRADGRAGVRRRAPGRHRTDGRAVQHDLLVEDRARIAGQFQPFGRRRLIVGGDVLTAAQPVDGGLVRGDHARAGAGLDGHVAQGHPPFHVQRAHRLAGVFDDIAGAAAEADGGDHGQGDVLARDAGLQPPVHRHPHGLGLALQQALGGQHMADLGRADAERQRPEGPMGGRMAVAADHGHPWLSQAQFRSHDMDHAPVVGVPTRQGHAMGVAVFLQPMHLSLSLGRDIGFQPVQTRRQGRGRMVQGRIGPAGTAHLQAARLDLAEGLGAGDLVDQVQVDIQHARRIGRFRPHDMGVPDLVEQGFGIRHIEPRPRTRR